MEQQNHIILLESQFDARDEPEEENLVMRLRGQIATQQKQLTKIHLETEDPGWLANKLRGEMLSTIDNDLLKELENVHEKMLACRTRYYKDRMPIPKKK